MQPAQAFVSCSSFFDDMICGWQIDLVGERDGGREGERENLIREEMGERKQREGRERDLMDLTLIRRDALYDTSETDSRFLFFYQRKCYGGRSACTLAHTELRNTLSHSLYSAHSAAYSLRLSSLPPPPTPSASPVYNSGSRSCGRAQRKLGGWCFPQSLDSISGDN